MKKSRFSDSQIIAVLKQAEAGTPVPELCCEHGISSATFYKWRSKFGGMDASLMSQLQELRDALSETCCPYQAKASEENARIADWLVRLTTAYRDWGFGPCFLHLRNVKGFGWNHKRVYRIYRELVTCPRFSGPA